MKKIIFTGGGTTGHVTKNTILIEALRANHPEIGIHYLGLKKGKEAELITPDLALFHPVSSGKLRRYFSFSTIPDSFRFLWGIAQSYRLLGIIEPDLVFSSGGFVALPVAVAAWMRKIPIVTHETDSYPGLANRMIGKMAKKILLGYESAKHHFDAGKTIHTGNPVAPSLFEGSKETALKKLGFSPEKKTLLVMGGSQGAKQINELVWEILPELVKEFQVIHLTGKSKLSDSSVGLGMTNNYRAFEYVTTDYADYLAAADLVISRSGGNSLAEIAALGKPAILIPLPLPAAAGDHQRKNALEMQKKNPNWVILEGEKATAGNLLEAIRDIRIDASRTDAMNRVSTADRRILEIVLGYVVR